MKRIAAVVFLLIMMLSMTSCGKQTKDSDIDEMVISQFMELTQIPRPSHHEEKVSAYLEKWAENKGLAVTRDAVNNIIFDVPATKGMENKPMIALQGHMDMVFAQKEDTNLDPLTTKITAVNDGTYLRSDGNTSLGADDGIGVAIMLCIADGRMEHGPLRIIITTDEEDGMEGTFNLDPKFVRDIDYLINLDAEQEGQVTVSTAAGVLDEFTKDVSACEPAGQKSITIRLKGCTGGHSGIDINKGGLNGAVVMGKLLSDILSDGVDYELQSFNAGTAPNAIVTSATAVIRIDAGEVEKVRKICGKYSDEFLPQHKDTDPNAVLELAEDDVPGRVMTAQDRDALLYFINHVVNGVNTWDPYEDGLVESSSNLGIVKADADSLLLNTNIRSESPERLQELTEGQEKLGEQLGMKVTSSKTADPWPYKNDNTMAELAHSAYKKVFNRDIEEIAVHAGLECGTFAVYNKDINMIALGPTIHNPHTVNETLEIATISKLWRLVEAIFAEA